LAYGQGPFAKHLSGAALRRLGMASFCLYLMQAPLLRGIKGVCMWRGGGVGTGVGFLVPVVGVFLFVPTAAAFLPLPFHLRLQKLLRTWIRRRPAQQTSGAALRGVV